MSERLAIDFIRQLIGHEGGLIESGRLDPGWCCNEHSIIASLAFALAGKKTMLCDGELLILTRNSSTVIDVVPHKFLVDNSSNIFDSSISFESVKGISTDKQKPAPGATILAGPDRHAIPELLRRLASSPFSRYFCYTAPRPILLNSKNLDQPIDDTPFGQWLTKHLGNQTGLVGKAAWYVYEALDGRPPAIGDTREAMWDAIAGSPNRDDAVASALTDIQKK